MYLTEQIRQSVLRPLDYRQYQQLSRIKNIRDELAFRLIGYVNAIYNNLDAKKPPYISNCRTSAFFDFAGSAFLYKFSDWIVDCLDHLRLCGHILVYRLAEASKLICAFLDALVYLLLLQYHEQHSKGYGEFSFGSQSISTGSTIRSRHHQQGPFSLVLRQSFSWV